MRSARPQHMAVVGAIVPPSLTLPRSVAACDPSRRLALGEISPAASNDATNEDAGPSSAHNKGFAGIAGRDAI